MDFKLFLDQKSHLIKAAIKRLNVYKSFDEFYQIGSIALFYAASHYETDKDVNQNFDVYAYYIILNFMKTELTRVNKYDMIEMSVDLYQNEYLAPIIEDDLLRRLDCDYILNILSESEKEIVKLRQSGYKTQEISHQLGISEDKLKYQLKLIMNKVKTAINRIKVN